MTDGSADDGRLGKSIPVSSTALASIRLVALLVRHRVIRVAAIAEHNYTSSVLLATFLRIETFVEIKIHVAAAFE